MSKIINNLLIVAAVIFFVPYAWQKYSDDRDYKSWPTAPIHLISAEVAVGRYKHGGRYFVVETDYEFKVDGRVYRSNLSKIGEHRFPSDEGALQYLADLKSRAEIRVHYDPHNPEKNAISR